MKIALILIAVFAVSFLITSSAVHHLQQNLPGPQSQIVDFDAVQVSGETIKNNH